MGLLTAAVWAAAAVYVSAGQRDPAVLWQQGVDLARDGRYAEALDILHSALQDAPRSTDLLFALAECHWTAGHHLHALRTYDRILALTPDHAAAINLRTRLLAAMGCAGVAADYAHRHSAVVDPAVRAEVEGALAAARIRWGEPHRALDILNRLIDGEHRPFSRAAARYDRILALRDMRRMEEVLEEYAAIQEQGIEPPYWVDQAAGDAYLYLRQPRKAVALYEEVIAAEPDLFNPRMALIDAYGDLNRHGQALARREELEQETPEWRLLHYNWEREQVTVAEGWTLAYDGRLGEAERCFRRLLERAPANLAARTGLAHVHLWRGHPSRALEEFDILLTRSGTDPLPRPPHVEERALSARNGRAAALNSAYRKREARRVAAALLERNPRNLHTRELNRQFDIEDGLECSLDVVVTDEDPGVGEHYVHATLTQPVTPHSDVYVTGLRRRSEGIGATSEYSRAAVGLSLDVTRDLTAGAEASLDVKAGGDTGFRVAAEWRATDRWTLDASHNTYSLQVPIRARNTGVDGTFTDASIRYRPNEGWAARIAASRNDLEDGNRSDMLLFTAEKALWTRSVVKSRLYAEVACETQSATNVPYFSPEKATTWEIMHRLDHTLYRRYDTALVHRLYMGFGEYRQVNFDAEPMWRLRYEHDLLWTDRFALLWGVNVRRRAYDGEQTDIVSFYLTMRRTF